MTRSIAARTLITTSASQITTFKGCERRWFGQFVLKLPVPQQASAAGGENEHKAFEDYYLKGVPLDPESAAARLIQEPEIPPRAEDILVEHPGDKNLQVSASGVPVRGRIDLVVPPRAGTITIVDWKSGSSLRFIKSAEELRTDTQAIIYSFAMLARWMDADSTVFLHGNVVRRKKDRETGEWLPLPKKAHKVVSSGRMERAYIEEQYRSRIETTVEAMQRVAGLATFDDAEPTGVKTGYCHLYPPAGCPFADRCSAVKSEATALFSIFGPDTSSTVPPQAGETSMSFTQTLQSRATGANQAEATDTTTAAGTGQNPALHLYINCQPKGLDVVYLTEENAKRAAAIVAEYNERKGTSLESVFEVPFGEGVKALAASYQRQPITGRVVAVTGGLLSGPVVEVLEAQAALVVRSLA